MKNNLTKLFDSNWFFVSLLGFVIALPLSQALVSIMGGIIFGVALIEDNWKNKLARFKRNKVLLTVPAIFILYLVSSLFTGKNGSGWYDIQKSLFFFIIPLAFVFGKKLSARQVRSVFYVFVVSVFISTIVALFRWKFTVEVENFSVHKIGLISHIRFSFQLILIIWFLLFLLYNNYSSVSFSFKIIVVAGAIYFLAFLFFQQSLTGVIAFISSLIFVTIVLIFKLNKRLKVGLLVLLFALITFPLIFVFQAVNSFYNVKAVDVNSVKKYTKLGNEYKNDFSNPMIENGNYVFIEVCEKEMREEWNKRSEFKYDSVGVNGYVVSATLIRYLTSKGLEKNAEGVKALSPQDIKNVENGVANIVFQSRKYSLYPRIYETVWEYYIYSHTGNANHQSFSQRIEFAKAALSIIKNNVLFGVGTGNWIEEFRKTFIKNSPQLDSKLYASSHNQYLNYMVKFGVIGFLLIVSFLVYPVIKTRSYTDMFFMVFLVFMFFANFADSNFESHMGSSFFLFFYCLFISLKEKNYLKASTG